MSPQGVWTYADRPLMDPDRRVTMNSERLVSTENSLGADFLSEARNQLAASRKLIAHCVGQIEDAQIWHREQDDLNSIGNLLLHLAGNLAQRFEAGIQGEPDRRNRPGEFSERTTIPKAELMNRLDGAIDKAEEILKAFDPTRLMESRPYVTLVGSPEISIQAVIFRTLMHFNGHAQEIVYMTRMLLKDRYQFQNPAGVPKRPAAH